MESVDVLAPAASPSDEMFAGDGGTLGGSWRRVLTTVCSVLSAHETQQRQLTGPMANWEPKPGEKPSSNREPW